jgi:phosphatidylinositol glycan class C protein
MNAALLTGMLLASRLSSNLHCFALMCFSLELFTLSPIVRHMLREYSESFHLVFTALLVFGVSILLFCTHELFFSSLWLMASTILPFFAPYMFIHLQDYKSVLWGPWDLGSGVPLTTTNQQQKEPN